MQMKKMSNRNINGIALLIFYLNTHLLFIGPAGWPKLHHCAVSGEGITYYPLQNGGAWKADSDGFGSNCPVSNVHELAIATHVISNNATTCMEI